MPIHIIGVLISADCGKMVFLCLVPCPLTSDPPDYSVMTIVKESLSDCHHLVLTCGTRRRQGVNTGYGTGAVRMSRGGGEGGGCERGP